MPELNPKITLDTTHSLTHSLRDTVHIHRIIMVNRQKTEQWLPNPINHAIYAGK